jgi:hypothetical protein
MTTHHPEKQAISVEQHDAPDAWHSHTADEKPQAAHGEAANAHVIILVGVGSFLLIVATVIVTYGYYTWYTTKLLNDAENKDAIGVVESESAAYKERSQADLRHYDWVPGEEPLVPKGTVRIPIDKAIDKTIAKYTQAPPPAGSPRTP